jgi:hypothetical protein
MHYTVVSFGFEELFAVVMHSCVNGGWGFATAKAVQTPCLRVGFVLDIPACYVIQVTASQPLVIK